MTLEQATQRISEATAYIRAQNPYAWRAARYEQVAREMFDPNPGRRPLTAADTLVDIGAGWTDYDYYLRREQDWRGRYIPVDAGIDGTDLATWQPAQRYSWASAIEVLEHLDSLDDVQALIARLKGAVSCGIVCSVPNPDQVDVLAQCADHKTVISRAQLEAMGFHVREWQASLIGCWRAP